MNVAPAVVHRDGAGAAREVREGDYDLIVLAEARAPLSIETVRGVGYRFVASSEPS